MAYPVTADVTAYLAAFGVTLTSDQLTWLPNEVTGAIDLFERLVGRKMEAAAANENRYFDPPDNVEGKLFFREDLASVNAVTYQPICAGSGSLLQLNTEYTLGPRNAAIKNRPYRWLQLGGSGSITSPVYIGYRGSYVVSGRWGYALTIPQLAKNSMIKLAATKILTPVTYISSGGVKRKRVEDYEVEYGTGQYSGQITSMLDDVQAAIRQYKIYI